MCVDSTLKVYALIGYPPREALDLAFSFAPIENLPGNRRQMRSFAAYDATGESGQGV